MPTKNRLQALSPPKAGFYLFLFRREERHKIGAPSDGRVPGAQARRERGGVGGGKGERRARALGRYLAFFDSFFSL